MIRTEDAIAVARSMLGTPYSTYDCINFIKAIIRKAPGGDPKYQTAGTNTLWRSKDLTERWESLTGPRPGMLAFKANGEDVHHVGLVTGPGTVLHSSSAKGGVVETDLLNGQWSYLAKHRLIEVDGAPDPGPQQAYTAKVIPINNGRPVNLRSGPSTSDGIIAKVPVDTMVDVLIELGDWDFIDTGTQQGYMASRYLERVKDPEPVDPDDPGEGWALDPIMINACGAIVRLDGYWRLAED